MVSLDEFYYTKKFGMHKDVCNCSYKIWVFHVASVEWAVLIDHEQFLLCKFTSPSCSIPFFFTFVYSKCSRRERYRLWNSLKTVAGSMSNHPWAVGGDFNIIAASCEKVGGNPPDLNAIADFCDSILDCNWLDVGFSGISFTWK